MAGARRWWRNGSGRAVLAAALLLPLLSGCIFEPRQAEPPAAGDVVQYNPRTSARNIWANVELALNATDPGEWDQILSPDFLYVPDDQTRSIYPNIDWDGWRKEQELTFVQNWFGSGISIQADMLRPDSENTHDPEGDAGTWDLIYFLRVTDQSGRETRYSGRALIHFRLEGNFWYIIGWEDLNGETDPDNPDANLQTLGVVRGAIASQ